VISKKIYIQPEEVQVIGDMDQKKGNKNFNIVNIDSSGDSLNLTNQSSNISQSVSSNRSSLKIKIISS